ncbi:fluoride efflux transporter CrcB [Endomicrobium proavitum]|uniref:Fluoride-specific ion channel FluC n=1 Tax=Endomicrobium proavitum TaxID=1408281 RepID=A0A0G3WGW0_9BACT|nr:fluoride efflux transporter CrcB [Endomicrobium proavitum]AKL97558.1 putative fluoride ion transporter CrcB [Endomicrobium proavitum]
MLKNAIAVFLGGAFGSLFRFLISEALPVVKYGIPFTVIFINFAGCFIMGAADGVFEICQPAKVTKHFLTVGLLGGFTTFSAFSLEFSTLIKSGSYGGASLYLLISIFMALLGFWLGYFLIKFVKLHW